MADEPKLQELDKLIAKVRGDGSPDGNRPAAEEPAQ